MLDFIRKNYSQAENNLNKAIEHFLRLNTLEDPYLALAYYWQGRNYLDWEKLALSETMLLNSIKIREKVFTNNNSKTWSAKGELGICKLKQKKYSEAEKLLIESLDFYKNDSYKDQKKLFRYTEHLAVLYEEIGDKISSKFYRSEYQKLTEESKNN